MGQVLEKLASNLYQNEHLREHIICKALPRTDSSSNLLITSEWLSIDSACLDCSHVLSRFLQ
jgi:hypothetical protein